MKFYDPFVLGKMLSASKTCVPNTSTDLWPSLRYEDDLTTFPKLMSDGLLRLNYFPHCKGGWLDEVFVETQVKFCTIKLYCVFKLFQMTAIDQSMRICKQK